MKLEPALFFYQGWKSLQHYLLKPSSIIGWEVLIWGILPKWTEGLSQNAESFVILCSKNLQCGLKLFAHICEHLRQRERVAPKIKQLHAYNYYTCFFFFKDPSNCSTLAAQAFSCSDIIVLSLFPDINS